MGWLNGGLTGDPDTNWLDQQRESRVEDGQPIDGADPGYVPGDKTAEIDEGAGDGGLTGDTETDVVTRFVATGDTRTLYDYAMDYEGEWYGQEDTQDLWGPSIDPRDWNDEGENVIDWRSEDSQADPTRPANVDEWPWYVWAGLVLLALVALRPYANLAAGATS